MSGILDWLFGPSAPVRDHGQEQRNREFHERQRQFEAAGYCSAWIDKDGKIRDKQCGATVEAAMCRESQLLKSGKVAYSDNSRTWDHNVSVEQRYLKGRGKHSSKSDKKATPQKRYADRLQLLKQVSRDHAEESGDPCRGRR